MGALLDLCKAHGVEIKIIKDHGPQVEPAKRPRCSCEPKGRDWHHKRVDIAITMGNKAYAGNPVSYRMGLPPPPRGERDMRMEEWVRYDHEVRARKAKVDDVIAALFGDASCYDSARNFADYCADMGMDEDSRTAERTYLACGEASKQLRALFGELFDTFAEAAAEH